MTQSGVLFEVRNNIGFVHLHNPKKANALSEFLVKDLQEQVRKLSTDQRLRAIIFTGGESKSFCAGADLKERQEMNEGEIRSYVSLLRQTFNEIADLPMPTIASIKGLALGGGCELVLACDMRVMEEDAVIGLTEVSWGIIPGAGGTQRLSQLVGIGMAKKLIFTAAKLPAEQAVSLGLVEEMCPSGEAEMKALKIAEGIAANSNHSVQLAKKAINYQFKAQVNEGLLEEWACYQETIPHPDRLEGLAAFKEKRLPDYKQSAAEV
ncbi:enoyl-CoA hydratase-related protein [Domibacillus epiphyticus]|uniref:Enoyl-CoA hydratase n=1 Tax=Domibacillus epiphyticus TaxID=1714355 RepID=A0A1V2A8G2_9BACI|nr:enoyl-CoA hydratase-related protein [Domibacillus epiphyticus]OMP67289.1 hypothetical protein BTO28_08155 [Domibacillus epiphyticus]